VIEPCVTLVHKLFCELVSEKGKNTASYGKLYESPDCNAFTYGAIFVSRVKADSESSAAATEVAKRTTMRRRLPVVIMAMERSRNAEQIVQDNIVATSQGCNLRFVNCNLRLPVHTRSVYIIRSSL
jgi:hypothetical protein